MRDTVFFVQTSAVRKVSVVQLVVQKGSPLGKVDKTKMDNTTAPFLLLKLLFSMCHLLSHTGSFSSLWQPHTACKKRDPGFIRETPPKGSLSRALYFAAGDMTECRMVSKAPQYVAPDRRTVIIDTAGKCAISWWAALWTGVTGEISQPGLWEAVLFHMQVHHKELYAWTAS